MIICCEDDEDANWVRRVVVYGVDMVVDVEVDFPYVVCMADVYR